jgi:hypothetical protein
MNRRQATGTLLRATAATGMALGLTAFPGTGAQAAQQVALTVTYTCTFPEIGTQSVAVAITSSAPNSIAVGQSTADIVVTATVTVPWELTVGLRAYGVSTVTGTAAGQADIDVPQGAWAETVPFTIPKISLPDFSSFTASATGSVPSITFSEPGRAEVTVGNLTAHLAPLDSNGNLTRLGEIDVPCTLKSGQDVTAASLAITAAPRVGSSSSSPASSSSGSARPTPSSSASERPSDTADPTGTVPPGHTTSSGAAPSGPDGASSQAAAASSSRSSTIGAAASGPPGGGDAAWAFGIGGAVAIIAAAAITAGLRARGGVAARGRSRSE